MKRSIFIAALTAFLLSLSTVQPANAQLFRACPSGACPTRARVAQYRRVYAPTVAPCQSVQTVEPCAPIETVAPCDPVRDVPADVLRYRAEGSIPAPAGRLPESEIQTVAPCDPVEPTVEPCDPVQTVAPCQTQADQREADYLPERKLVMNAPSAPCDPVQTVAPCQTQADQREADYLPERKLVMNAPSAPCESCARGEYLPTDDGDVCVGGTCPIRTAVRATAKGAVETVAATTRWLPAVNRVRAQYNLPALKADVNLDAGCASQANYCARTGRLVHGSGVAEILAQNQSGIDAAIIQWLASPAHRSLMLSSSYRFAGVSVVRGADGRVWCAMRFR